MQVICSAKWRPRSIRILGLWVAAMACPAATASAAPPGLTPSNRTLPRTSSRSGLPWTAAGETVCGLEDSAHCQLPDQQGHGGTSVVAATSDVSAGFTVADNFTPETSGTVSQVCWWGIYVDFAEGGIDCGPGPGDDFTITYFANDNGIPGAQHAGPFNLTDVQRLPTGRFVLGFTEYSYSASHTAVTVEQNDCYWIEIVNNTAETCFWLWNTAPPGDSMSVQDFNGNGYDLSDREDYDLAWCVEPIVEPGGCGSSCELGCAPNATPEGEPDCEEDYVDTFNGGCHSTPPVWSSIAPGDVVCGRGGNFAVNDVPCNSDQDCFIGDCGNVTPGFCDQVQRGQDTDWYELDLSQRKDDAFLRVQLSAEFQAVFGFIDAQNNTCQNPDFIEDAMISVAPCSSNEIEICLSPGIYSIFVSTLTPGTLAPCPSIYNIVLEDLGACPEFSAVCNLEDTLRCQLPNQSGNGGGNTGGVSDSNPIVNTVIADDFQSLAGGPITEVCWWGFYLDAANDNTACGPGAVADDFTITYYNDDAGGVVPGSIKAGPFPIGPADDKSATGETIPGPGDGYLEFGFTATHPTVTTQPGECIWISISNNTTGGGECVWAWSSAAPGDERSARDEGAGFDEDLTSSFDLAWCISTFVTLTGCELTGACCDDVFGLCFDDVSILECDGRFKANTQCAELNPPCGGGACCNPQNGTCTDTLEDDCTTQFHPDVFCSAVLCNQAETCDWTNGAARIGPSVGSQYAPNEWYVQAADNFTLKGQPGQCNLDSVSWTVGHFNHQGTCPDGSNCTLGSMSACDDQPETCIPGSYTNTPDDYEAINVVVYADTFVAGAVQRYGVQVDQDIPEGVAPGEPAHCVNSGTCNPGEECIDNNGDGAPECTLVSEVTVDLDETILDLDVELLVEHSWQGDLVIRLQKLGGPTVTLMNRPGDNDQHPGTFGPDGYRANNFGAVNEFNRLLRLDDDVEVHINDYAGPTPGVDDFVGPAGSGGGGDAAGALGMFDGLSKSGTWRLYVSDDYGATDQGRLLEWRLRFVDIPPVPSEPNGQPEFVPVPVACATAADCAESGCPGASCPAGTCMLEGNVCMQPRPTGRHNGPPAAVCELQPEQWTWAPVDRDGQPLANIFALEADLGPCSPSVIKNTGYYLAISPVLPFATGPFYQTGWLRSVNRDGIPAKQTVAALPWAPLADLDDLTFDLTGSPGEAQLCPNGTIQECADLDSNNLRDDPCVWWACVAGTCAGTAVAFADYGGPFGACQPDGVADGNDHFSALNCFANTDGTGQAANYPCEDTAGRFDNSAFNTDVAGKATPCQPDGLCDGADAFAARDVFAGGSPCQCPAGEPYPEFKTDDGDIATLALRGARRTLGAGDEIEIDVHLTTPLRDLRGYQLHMNTTGGHRGTLDLVDIGIKYAVAKRPHTLPDESVRLRDARREHVRPRARPTSGPKSRAPFASTAINDHVFNGHGYWDAYNITTRQMVVGLYTGGIAVDAGYLATLTFRASDDATGRFLIELLTDFSASKERTILFPSSSLEHIRVEPTKPFVVEVTGH